MMLLDTCIIIDVLRGKAAAFDFVSSLENAPALSVVTITDLSLDAETSGNAAKSIDCSRTMSFMTSIAMSQASLAITSGGMGQAMERTRSTH
jgi:predicted nucleic acid-binding protein